MGSARLDACLDYVATHIENAIRWQDLPASYASSWGIAEAWMRQAETLMKYGVD